ncbi:three-helix bundle dimerization domain-containing protein [Terrabacter carboxydivorans]|uniref:Uncharacterized protein n=1 Tax=Terrabacter carboxydivorans TaxID=619730 RepID=A0ABN3MFE5_9MICO
MTELAQTQAHALDQNHVVETLCRIYDGVLANDEIRLAVESTWGQLVLGARDTDFLSVHVARQVRKQLLLDATPHPLS